MSDRNLDALSLARLEAAVRNAGDYVHPTDELRPRTLEAAREQVIVQRGGRRMFALAAAIVVAATIGFPAAFYSAAMRAPLGISSAALQSLALERVVSEGMEPGAAMAEAYADFRQAQADGLTATRRSQPGS